jgi:hypothetical protein
LLEGCGDGEIMAYVDDTAREGDTLGMVLGGASEDLSGEVLELDRFRDATRFVEAIHDEVAEKANRSGVRIICGFIEMIIDARNSGSMTHTVRSPPEPTRVYRRQLVFPVSALPFGKSA